MPSALTRQHRASPRYRPTGVSATAVSNPLSMPASERSSSSGSIARRSFIETEDSGYAPTSGSVTSTTLLRRDLFMFHATAKPALVAATPSAAVIPKLSQPS